MSLALTAEQAAGVINSSLFGEAVLLSVPYWREETEEWVVLVSISASGPLVRMGFKLKAQVEAAATSSEPVAADGVNALRVHPLQHIEVAADGVIRFRSNKIVEYLLEEGSIDMNQLARGDFSQEDREQFAQLIGYSVSGFGDLSYANPETVRLADALARQLAEATKKQE